jgi:hypothetical protein
VDPEESAIFVPFHRKPVLRTVRRAAVFAFGYCQWVFQRSLASAADQFLQVFRVTGDLYRDPRGGGVNFAEHFGCQVDGGGAEIFEQARQLRRARDRHNPESK